MPRLLSISSLSCGLVSALCSPARAQSCDAPACVPDVFFPAASGATVAQLPANLQTFLLRRGERHVHPGADDAGASDAAALDAAVPMPPLPRLVLATSFGIELEVATRVAQRDEWLVITPLSPLSPGSTLRVESGDPCARTKIGHTFQISPSVPLPTSLGTLRQRPTLGGVSWRMADDSCQDDSHAATVMLDLELSGAARPFADVLRYALRVDGELRAPFQTSPHQPDLGVSALGKGKDQLSAPCLLAVTDPRAMPACSTSQVQMVGLLPDGTEIGSDTISVSLCVSPSCREVPYDGQPCHRQDQSQQRAADPACWDDPIFLDNFIQDAGARGAQAGDAASGHDSDVTTEARPDAGCTLSREPRREGAALPWLLGATWLLAIKRARRRSR